jgi:hypothetical protein
VNTTEAYCVIPGGYVACAEQVYRWSTDIRGLSHPDMSACCAELANSTVMFLPNCYYWCNLTAVKLEGTAPLSETFNNCLDAGNSTKGEVGMLC